MAHGNQATVTPYLGEKKPVLVVMLLVGYILIRTLWGWNKKTLKMEDEVFLALLHFYAPSSSVSTSTEKPVEAFPHLLPR